jgi:hypothetical protein
VAKGINGTRMEAKYKIIEKGKEVRGKKKNPKTQS